jgi:hypothetical protein
MVPDWQLPFRREGGRIIYIREYTFPTIYYNFGGVVVVVDSKGKEEFDHHGYWKKRVWRKTTILAGATVLWATDWQ